MENIQKQEEKSFNQLLCETKLNLFSIEYSKLIQEEIDKIDCSGKDETGYFACQGYEEGLKKAFLLFKELKEKQ